MTFDEILRDIEPDESARNQLLDLPLKEAVTKQPKLAEGWMRQGDYSSKSEKWQNQVRELEARATKDTDYLNRWEAWEKNEWPTLQDKLKTAADRERELNDRIRELQEQSETDMTFDEIKDSLKKENLLFDETQAAQAFSKMLESDTYKTDQNRRVGMAMGIQEKMYAATAGFPLKFQREFGTDKDFPMTEFLEYVGRTNALGDYSDVPKKMQDAYEQFVSGDRARKVESSYKQEVEEAKRQADEAKRMLEESRNKSIPADVERGVAPVGRFEKRIMDKRTEAAEKGGGKLGDGSATAQGLEALRNGTLVSK